jgi:hypothetical protein
VNKVTGRTGPYICGTLSLYVLLVRSDNFNIMAGTFDELFVLVTLATNKIFIVELNQEMIFIKPVMGMMAGPANNFPAGTHHHISAG